MVEDRTLIKRLNLICVWRRIRLGAICLGFASVSIWAVQAEPQTGYIGYGPVIQDGVGAFIYEPMTPSAEVRPMVFLFGGSEGGYARGPLLPELIKRNMIVIEMAYFGFEGGPKHLTQIRLEAIESHIRTLSERYQGEMPCIGVVGVSKGAELALLIATQSTAAQAYIAVVPTDVVWQASAVTLSRKSSWTRSGAPLPFVPYPWFSLNTIKAIRSTKQANALHVQALKNKTAVRRAQIPIHKAAAPIFLQSGMFDQVWPSTEMARNLINRAEAYDPAHRMTHTAYATDHFVMHDEQAIEDALEFIEITLNSECLTKSGSN